MGKNDLSSAANREVKINVMTLFQMNWHFPSQIFCAKGWKKRENSIERALI
jgi:hypothetical protein